MIMAKSHYFRDSSELIVDAIFDCHLDVVGHWRVKIQRRVATRTFLDEAK